MKHLVLLSIFTVLLFACRKDPVTPKTEEELLPPATQEGKRTFGCLINGKAWTPKAGFVPPPISVSYDEISGQLNIHARRILGNSMSQHVIFYGKFSSPDTIYMPSGTSLWADSSSVCAHITSIDPLTGIGHKEYWNTNGTLIITKVDWATGIISGTFEYDAYSPECQDTVKITQGRFDVRYKYQ